MTTTPPDIPELMTLKELVAWAATLLAEQDLDQASGRVSETPSTRTIRYYAKHALLDRPADWRGRAALYSMKHLLQIVAIKRMQSNGLTLEQIHDRMLGLDEDDLRQLADLDSTSPPPPPTPSPAPARADFWRASPAPPATSQGGARASPTRATAMSAVELDGITLLLHDARRLPDDDDLAAIEAAAQPLLRLLEARRLK